MDRHSIHSYVFASTQRAQHDFNGACGRVHELGDSGVLMLGALQLAIAGYAFTSVEVRD